MNSLDIILYVSIIAGFVAVFRWGYALGHQDGVLEGRIAVRKFYQAQKVSE